MLLLIERKCGDFNNLPIFMNENGSSESEGINGIAYIMKKCKRQANLREVHYAKFI